MTRSTPPYQARRHTALMTLLAGTLTTTIALPASAAVIEEIVVTAQKREQSVQDVGIAISALTGDQMQQLGFTNAQQVTALAPGVSTVQSNGEANYSLAIRGVANSDFTTNVESPVAVYMDDVYISQSSGTGFMLFDMERVEILRGPQGTLYGRNATGGLAHFLSKKPTEEFEGYAQFTAGEYGQFKGEGALGGPINDQLMGRFSISHHSNDGYVDNRLGGKLNNADDTAIRAQLLWAPTENVDVLFNARGFNQEIDTGFFEHVSANQTGVLTPDEVNQVLGYIDNDGDPFAGDYDAPGFNDLKTRGYTATVNWEFENVSLTSITDFSSVEREYSEDSDASPVPLFNFYLTTDAEQFSQELRLSGGNEKLNWLAGLYYLNIEVDDSNGAVTEPFIDPNSDTPAESGLDNPYETNTESWSVFGQMEYAFTDQLTGIFGLRWIRDEKDHVLEVNAVDFIPGTVQRNGNPNILANIASYAGERTDDEFAWRLALNYFATEDLMIYGSYNRGVKNGGFNAPVFPLSPPLEYTDDFISYDPERLDAFEIGFKSTLMDGLMTVNGTAYYYDYKDYQAFQIIGIDTITTNATAESMGAELEIQASPTDGLDLIFGAAYNDVEVDLENGTPKTTSIQSPKWNLNALVRYEFDAGPGKLAAQVDAQYRSRHFFSLTGLETVEENGYVVMNGSLRFSGPEDNWHLTAFVHNLTDEEYLVQTFDLSGPDVFGMVEQYYGRPRWAGFSLGVNF